MCASISFTFYLVTAQGLELLAVERGNRGDLLTAVLSLPCFTSVHLIRADSRPDRIALPARLTASRIRFSGSNALLVTSKVLSIFSISFFFSVLLRIDILFELALTQCFSITSNGSQYAGALDVGKSTFLWEFESLKLARADQEEWRERNCFPFQQRYGLMASCILL